MAANAEGINERCLKRQGRWKTDVAKDGYIKDSLDKKLAVSMSLIVKVSGYVYEQHEVHVSHRNLNVVFVNIKQ